jgi:hypothetical protein
VSIVCRAIATTQKRRSRLANLLGVLVNLGLQRSKRLLDVGQSDGGITALLGIGVAGSTIVVRARVVARLAARNTLAAVVAGGSAIVGRIVPSSILARCRAIIRAEVTAIRSRVAAITVGAETIVKSGHKCRLRDWSRHNIVSIPTIIRDGISEESGKSSFGGRRDRTLGGLQERRDVDEQGRRADRFSSFDMIGERLEGFDKNAANMIRLKMGGTGKAINCLSMKRIIQLGHSRWLIIENAGEICMGIYILKKARDLNGSRYRSVPKGGCRIDDIQLSTLQFCSKSKISKC